MAGLGPRCGQAREKFFVLTALAPKGPAFQRAAARDATATEERDQMRWMYRRADDLAALWPCE